MRILYFVVFITFSLSAYAGKYCESDVFLNVEYWDHSGQSHKLKVLGSNSPIAQTVVPPIPNLVCRYTKNGSDRLRGLLEKHLDTGAQYEIVEQKTTQPIKLDKQGTVNVPFIIRTGKFLSKKQVEGVGPVELLGVGCNASPRPVRGTNKRLLSTEKPVKVEFLHGGRLGGETFRLYFKKNDRLIWLNYLPYRDGDCTESGIARRHRKNTKCDKSASKKIDLTGDGISETVAVSVTGENCEQAIYSVNIKSSKGALLYSFKHEFNDMYVAHSYDRVEAFSTMGYLVDGFFKNGIHKTMRPVNELPHRDEVDGIAEVRGVSKEKYLELKANGLPYIYHSTWYEGGQMIVYDPSSKSFIAFGGH